MKVNRHELQTALSILKRVALTVKGMEDHTCSFVHLSTHREDGHLRLVANDLEVAVVAEIAPIGDPDPFKQDAILPAKLFHKLIAGAKKGDKETVGLDVLKASKGPKPNYRVGEDAVQVDVEGMKTKLTANNTPDNFLEPTDQLGDLVDAVEVGQYKTTAKALEYVLQAASDDATRYNISQVMFNFEDRVVVATDGHRMHFGPVQGGAVKEQMQKVLTPKLFVDVVAKVLKTAESVTKANHQRAEFVMHKDKTDDDRSVFRFVLDGKIKWTVLCRVPDCEFPEYKYVVPEKKQCYNAFTVGRTILEKLCKRMTAIQEGVSQPGGIFELGDGVLTVESRSSTKASTEVEVETVRKHKGETKVTEDNLGNDIKETVYKRTVGANLKYLVDAVSPKLHDTVEVFYRDELNPILVDNGDGFEAVVMPMRQ